MLSFLNKRRAPLKDMLLERSNDRLLPSHYQGDILIWDIDKTYLDTPFTSWRGLLNIPFEFAIDKRTIPGAVPLLRALRRGITEESAIVPLYFVSGSPAQLRRVIERRMTLDGVDYDGITFKDQWALLRAWRLQEIRAQIGYKLIALLLYRHDMPTQSHILCFGDDVESDAEIFILFGEICAGLRAEPLRKRLLKAAVPANNIAHILRLTENLPTGDDPVEKIFIHLARGLAPPENPPPRVINTRSYLQTALILCAMQRIHTSAVSSVAQDLRRRGMAESTIMEHLIDATARFNIPEHMYNLVITP